MNSLLLITAILSLNLIIECKVKQCYSSKIMGKNVIERGLNNARIQSCPINANDACLVNE